MRLRILLALLCLGLRGFLCTPANAVDAGVRQLIVGIAPDWNSLKGRLQLFRRDAQGHWQPASEPVPVLFGKNGLAWGRGVEGTDETGLHKQERDGRAPAGVFNIGTIYTYDAALPPGADYPFHQVTTADAWVDDSGSPNYNKFVTIPNPADPPAWFDKMKMRHGGLRLPLAGGDPAQRGPARARRGKRDIFPHPPWRKPPDERLHDDG